MKTKEIKKFRENYTDYKKECVFEGYKLAVHFDEKDIVKRMGAKWNPDEQIWWMPAKQLKEDAEPLGGPPNGSLVIDVLNDNEMIMGQYGKIKKKSGLNNNDASIYELQQGASRITVQWWDAQDAVSFKLSGDNDTVWYTVEDARIQWENLLAEGYNRVELS
tara:strand:+ start:532 stop:1017 length:486 start_codon:yes stop_codon:yes gene_type:complete